MKVYIRDHVTTGADSLTHHAADRVEEGLCRCLDRIRRVFVEFTETDRHGPTPFTRCFIRVETTGEHPIAIDGTRRCPSAALDVALESARRMLLKRRAICDVPQGACA